MKMTMTLSWSQLSRQRLLLTVSIEIIRLISESDTAPGSKRTSEEPQVLTGRAMKKTTLASPKTSYTYRIPPDGLIAYALKVKAMTWFELVDALYSDEKEWLIVVGHPKELRKAVDRVAYRAVDGKWHPKLPLPHPS